MHLSTHSCTSNSRILANKPANCLQVALRVTEDARQSPRSCKTTALPVVELAAGLGIEQALRPAAETVASYNLPAPLIKFGHPGNMAVVLLAMGGYGSYLGWQLRLSDNPDVILKAKDLHPKLAVGMTFFFSLGAVGGLLSLLTQGKPLFQSPHALTGIIGLLLLYSQGMITLFFEDDPNARSIHAYYGSAIMALFSVHMLLGINLALSLP